MPIKSDVACCAHCRAARNSHSIKLLSVAMERQGRVPFREQKIRVCRTAVNVIKVLRSSLNLSPVFFFCAILIKFGFYRQIFIKISNVNFDEKSSNESRADTCRETDGRTDRPDEANRPFSRLTRTRLQISTRQKIYELRSTRTEAPSILNILVSSQLVMLFNTLKS